MDIDKLRALVELSRRGTMAAVAQATGYGTSAVSQQLAALERQVGVPLLEASGRRVRLTPAGRRLAGHGEGILAAVAAAETDVAARGEPHGEVGVAGFTTALRQRVLPALSRLPDAVTVRLHESEPGETEALLDEGAVDLGLVYDFTLVPRTWRHSATLLGSSPMVLAVPPGLAVPDRIRAPADLDALRDVEWIGNSRDGADDELAARLCALAGRAPRIRQRADSRELLADLVEAGLGACVLPADGPEAARVRTVALDLVPVELRMWGLVRAGTGARPATAAVLRAVQPSADGGGPGPSAGA